MFQSSETFTDYTAHLAYRATPEQRLSDAVLLRYMKDVLGNDTLDKDTGFYVRHYGDGGEANRDFHRSRSIINRISLRSGYDPAFITESIQRLIDAGYTESDIENMRRVVGTRNY